MEIIPSSDSEKPILPGIGELTTELAIGHLALDIEPSSVSFRGGPNRRSAARKRVVWSLLAAMIDLGFISGFSGIYIYFLKSTFKWIGLQSFFKFIFLHEFLGLFIAVFFIQYLGYLVLTRHLFARTLGEWACSLSLGLPYQTNEVGYMARVTARALLMIITGGIFFPILSLILGKDVLGAITGVRIHHATF